ncbi:hypothetical protein CYG49_03650 [Candidatus Saccharibacteria bacterium]|nr:MAG: hypothetical protein CYG49_03650 [Candidatus Saccharibacteria bacterium]
MLPVTAIKVYHWWNPTESLRKQVYAEHEKIHTATNDMLEIVDERSECRMQEVWFLPTRTCTYRADINHAGKTKAEVREILIASGWVQANGSFYKNNFECMVITHDSTGFSEYFKSRQSDHDKVTFNLSCSKGIF